MGRYTLDDDDSDISEEECAGSQWGNEDVVMQDSYDDDDHDENTGTQQRQQSSSMWNRALVALPNRQKSQDSDDCDETLPAKDSMEPSYSYQVVGRAESGDLVPIHYHVYNNAPNDDDDNRRQSSTMTSCGWMLISLVAVLAHICYWYGPSVPPPDDESQGTSTTTTNWHEFMAQEAAVLWSLLLRWGAIAKYVGYWCFEAMSRESAHLLQQFQSSSSTTDALTTAAMTSTVPIPALDCHSPWRWDMNRLSQQVVGQDLAMDKLHKIFEKEWNSDGQQQQADMNPQPHRVELSGNKDQRQRRQRQHPLILYAIGGQAVGKKELAYSLARQFLGKDCSGMDVSPSIFLDLDKDIPDNNPGNHDESDAYVLNSSNESMQYQRLLDHAIGHPHGSVVLWSLDDSSEQKQQVSSFLQKVQKLPAGSLDRMIIVLTSKIGNPTINKVLRKYGRQDLPVLELESFLRYELVEAYNTDTKAATAADAGTAPATTTQAKLFSNVHILTFLPLGRESMRIILRKRLQSAMWDRVVSPNVHGNSAAIRKFHIPNDAIDYMLNNGLEWQQWIHKKTDQLMLEFSPDGARGLEPLLLRITSSCPAVPSSDDGMTAEPTTTTLLLLDKTMGKFEMITCPTKSDYSLDDCTIDCQFVL